MNAVAEGVMRIIAAKSKRDQPVHGSDWLDELGIESLEVVGSYRLF